MSEHDNLQDADGDNLNATPQEQSSTENPTPSEETTPEEVTSSETPTEESTATPEKAVEPESSTEEETSEKALKEEEKTSEASTEEAEEIHKNEDVIEEESAVDYETLSLEQLIAKFETLLNSENIHSVRNSINEVKNNFNTKFSALISEKKEAFLAEGGNAIDFEFISPLKKQFNELSKTFREKHQSFQRSRTEELNQNLEIRLQIIEEIKGLINVEGDINSAYKTFKNLQERWRNTRENSFQ